MFIEFKQVYCDEDGAPIGETPKLINFDNVLSIEDATTFTDLPPSLKWNETGIRFINGTMTVVKPSYKETIEILKRAASNNQLKMMCLPKLH